MSDSFDTPCGAVVVLADGSWSEMIDAWQAHEGHGHALTTPARLWKRLAKRMSTLREGAGEPWADLPDVNPTEVSAAVARYRDGWPGTAQKMRRNPWTGDREYRLSMKQSLTRLGRDRSKAVLVEFRGALRDVPWLLGHGEEGEVPLGAARIGLLWEAWSRHSVTPIRFDGGRVHFVAPDTPDFEVALELACALTGYCSDHPENLVEHLQQIAGSPVWTLAWG